MSNKLTRILLFAILVLLLLNLLFVFKQRPEKRIEKQIDRISLRLDSAESTLHSAIQKVDTIILENEKSKIRLNQFNLEVEQIKNNYEAGQRQSEKLLRKLKSGLEENNQQLLKLREELNPLK